MTRRARRAPARRWLRVLLYGCAASSGVLLVLVAWYFGTLYPAGPPQRGYLALTGATVLVGEELEARSQTTLLIQNGEIVAIGRDDEVAIPSSAQTMDLSAYTLLPGLIDTHVHLGMPEQDVGDTPSAVRALRTMLDAVRFVPAQRRALLASGVTAVRDLGNDYGWIIELRRLLRDGELEGPRLFVAGPVFTTPGGHPIVTAGVPLGSGVVRVPATAPEARNAVRELAAGEGRVDLIKVVQDRGGPGRALQPIALDVLRAIVDEAHVQGLTVTAHWGTLQDLDEVLAAGVDVLEHLEGGGELTHWPSQTLAVLVERRIPLSPTLTATAAKLPPAVIAPLRQRLAEFHAGGGRVLAGTDAGMPGVPFGASLHRSLELQVDSGLTPRDALRAATSESARALRIERIGAIALGRAADLVAVVGNPLEAIAAARNVALVFRDGRLVVDRTKH